MRPFPLRLWFVLFTVTGVLSLPSCSSDDSGRSTPGKLFTIKIAGKELKVEVVNTEEKREAGLAFRKSLPPDQGMLFVYPEDEYQSFWMKNTFVPLSIAFIRSDGWVSQIEDMAPETLESHRSNIRVKYVLEMPQGWFRKNGVKVGDSAQIPPELAKALE